MTRLEPFRQLARLCRQKGIENVIICPGSRNAILTIAFTSEPGLNCYSISDERSAGYIALGMALQTGLTTALICTSGTAALNFAPAVAEAFFQEVPLLILTADRPPEWIHQYDGQTIFQNEVYGKHVKKAFSWSPDQSEKDIEAAAAMSLEAVELCQRLPQGPVHINIPVSEPFYPDEIDEIDKEWPVNSSSDQEKVEEIPSLEELLDLYPKRLLVVGQQHDESLYEKAAEFARRFGFVLVSDCIGNVRGGVKNHDHFLKSISKESKSELIPDFLISTDMSLISKSLKLMLREGDIKAHWHIQDNPFWIDPFRSLTKKVKMAPALFFDQSLRLENRPISDSYIKSWEILDQQSDNKINQFFENESFTEFHFLKKLITQAPKDIIFHVGNSMSIRYMNALQKYLPDNSLVYGNRGTSGIDGSLSTAVGQAIKTKRMVLCVLGDLSFQYDKNALWNRYLPDNLKIVVLNNAGGIIFNMIDGPARQESFNTFFKTQQPNTARWIAKEFDLSYFSIKKQNEIHAQLEAFLKEEGKAILEIFTDYETNSKVFKEFFK